MPYSNPKDEHRDQLARVRRAIEAESLTDASAAGSSIWIFCVWCGRVQLVEPRWLLSHVKDAPNQLDELERRLCCSSCKRRGVRLIPTPRTMVSFERMVE